MVSVIVAAVPVVPSIAVSVSSIVLPCKDEEVVTSQAGSNAAVEPAAPSLLALLVIAPSSFFRWEALSVVRANLAVVVVLLVVVLPLLPVVPFLPGVGSRDALRALPPVVPDDADRTFCALGGASLDRMGRSRTHT